MNTLVNTEQTLDNQLQQAVSILPQEYANVVIDELKSLGKTILIDHSDLRAVTTTDMKGRPYPHFISDRPTKELNQLNELINFVRAY